MPAFVQGGVLRPRAMPQRRSIFRVAALAAAPFAAYSMWSGLRPQASSRSVDDMQELVFVSPPVLQCESGPRSSSRVTMAAGKAAKPGGRPVDVNSPPVDVAPSNSEENIAMQFDRVAKRAAWLKQQKGKFVPWGAKPWDAHKFRKVQVVVNLEPKQAANSKIMAQVVAEIRAITGKHPKIKLSKVNDAIKGWRKGMTKGAMVWLMGQLMEDFLTRLNMVYLPRVRDFEGIAPNDVTTFGDLTLKIETQEPFKELDEMVDNRELIHSFKINIITNCMTQPDALNLLKGYGFPFGDPRIKARKLTKEEVLQAKYGSKGTKKK
mmetsp:Transcript_68651/g.174340  ORF Transcript_68651/g.174340 Transcript_68651/m.174340 type:complete len:321 (-) Transcript_68651:121-1083(-)|eukprot:CAMPEP_0183426890 /NCGR_PEP_ID=MMETSP0370-20130417/39963_1 /TAXON_ID=268820 /ORGANISM="Peridinium aciculiferum, Strain PAER-2" /LENGTH=320 /DNA_ID=CAMNT_0025611367 /DNA_START=58 /DNA_END=1020 /DNA_ORIENTATION=+